MVYGDLLRDRALISDITSEEVRGAQRYRFDILGKTCDYPMECTGVIELAKVLSSMWSVHLKTRFDLGIDDSRLDTV